MTQKNENDATATKQIVYLEVLLTEDKRYVSDWHMRTGELVEGLIKSDALFPSSTDPILSRFYYLTVSTHKSPWELAHTIEQLPHVDSCTPDIELATDIGLEEHKVKTTEQTVQFEGLFGKRSAEEKFLAKWGSSDWVKKAHAIDKLFHRQWHWVAVNHPEIKSPASLNPLKESLQQLRFVQLDTGYTVHPKIFSSYNLDQDLDFLDDDENALDMMADAFLQHPAHGTRTASIALGSKHQEIIEDGNIGILTDGNANPLTKLIPYRIAKSVILINRGKQLVDAASHAIRNGTDVMFMCMGSIPRDMFDAVAREAYEQGVIWVCAAGNQVRFVIAPACYPGTIAVAAINPDDKAWSGSCRGDMVDISAPGEDCYVPGWDDDNRYCMSYGSGTSYATPQVASAAMLWKAKNLDKLSTAYQYKWQIVEAFRHCIKSTARSNNKLPAGKFGAGVLDIEKLLAAKLPAAGTLHHAYSEKGLPPVHPIGEREMAHTIWNSDTIAAERKAGESMTRVAWSNRAKEAYNALVKQSTVNATESMTTEKPKDNFSLLESYFKPY